MAGDVFPVAWDSCSVQRTLIIPHSSGCPKLGDLTIIQESGNDVWQREACPVGVSTVDARTLSKESNEAVEERKHHLGWQIGSRTSSIVVAESLTIFIVHKFRISESSTPR
jgi:hypothetical protein